MTKENKRLTLLCKELKEISQLLEKPTRITGKEIVATYESISLLIWSLLIKHGIIKNLGLNSKPVYVWDTIEVNKKMCSKLLEETQNKQRNWNKNWYDKQKKESKPIITKQIVNPISDKQNNEVLTPFILTKEGNYTIIKIHNSVNNDMNKLFTKLIKELL